MLLTSNRIQYSSGHRQELHRVTQEPKIRVTPRTSKGPSGPFFVQEEIPIHQVNTSGTGVNVSAVFTSCLALYYQCCLHQTVYSKLFSFKFFFLVESSYIYSINQLKHSHEKDLRNHNESLGLQPSSNRILCNHIFNL